MSEPGSDMSDLEAYEDIVSRPLPNDGLGKILGYTNLVTNKRGCWFCPKCFWTKGSLLEWALRTRGFSDIPDDYAGFISKAYGDWLERIYFLNASGVTRCMNVWTEGFSGFRCTFDRAKIEQFHDRALDLSKEFGTPLGTDMGYCAQCSFVPGWLKIDPELKAHVQSLSNIPYSEVLKKAPYILHKEDPFTGKPRVMRQLLYNETEESLWCTSEKYGAGLREEVREGDKVVQAASKDTKCTGCYGGPVIFWASEELPDGSIKWYEWDWDPSQVEYKPPVIQDPTDEDLRDAYGSDFDDEDDDDDDGNGSDDEDELGAEGESSPGEVFHFSGSSSS